jgi:hypothetical protein
VLDAPDRQAADDQIDRQKRQSCKIGRGIAEIEGHAERAAGTWRSRSRPGEPPNAVAKNTAGKYGVKKTSGRISERHQRAAVASARQQLRKSEC